MKIMQLKRYGFSILVTAFLVIFTGNAFAANNPSRNIVDGKVDDTFANNFIVTSPYWQVDSGSYTFIAVSHSSLSGMASQIGVKINAITSAGAAYDTAESFTVTAGSTQRVFIVPTNHATVNSTTITSGAFLAGTTDFTYGHIRATPVATHPHLIHTDRYKAALTHGAGIRDSTTLTYWGSVIIEANTTGFAMEFIGDMNDSTTPAVTFRCNAGQGATHTANTLSGNCNSINSSGVNLQ
tara:strand:- start:557 stop:1273 length:717 start_codon:yes stop_codon:yes gene_type:complete